MDTIRQVFELLNLLQEREGNNYFNFFSNMLVEAEIIVVGANRRERILHPLHARGPSRSLNLFPLSFYSVLFAKCFCALISSGLNPSITME